MIVREAETVEVITPTGPMQSRLYRPAEEGVYPGVILFTEIFQLTGPMVRTAQYFAGRGMLVIVPEIYHQHLPPGTVLGYDEAGARRGNELKKSRPIEAWDDDTVALLEYLAAHPACSGQLGTLGFCIGGHLALRAAAHSAVRAAACCYATDVHGGTLGSHGSDTLRRISRIKADLLFHWGRQDNHVPPEGRAAIYGALQKAGASFEWHEWNAGHGFMRDDGARYQPDLHALCYRNIEVFFNACLR